MQIRQAPESRFRCKTKRLAGFPPLSGRTGGIDRPGFLFICSFCLFLGFPAFPGFPGLTGPAPFSGLLYAQDTDSENGRDSGDTLSLPAPNDEPITESVAEWGAESDPELENYLERIDTAQQMRNYNLAIKLLTEARQRFPQTALLPFLIGELYEQQHLLRLSLESYREARRLEPENTRFIYRMANLQDRLGKYAEAVASYRLLERYGNSTERNEARRKNGWLLYKLHRYQEAEASILAIPAGERNSSIMMTLAIIYSAAYNYKESSKAYEQSLALAYPQFRNGYSIDDRAAGLELRESTNQRALIYYNYALLEADFRHFDQAMQLNEKSVADVSFPSNELLRGELYLRQHQFYKAKDSFLRSQRLEEQSARPSPLALLDLIQLSVNRGKPQEGMIFLRELDLRFRKQTEWMTSYGIDPVNFELELMELREALYKGLLQEQTWLLPLSGSESLRRYGNIVKYRWLYWYSSIRKKLLSHEVGKEHYRQGNSLDSNQKLYGASDEGSRVRRRFFRRLKKEHLALVPNSEGVLLLEEAIIERSAPKMEQSLKLLDAKWDAENREKAYIELSKLRPTSQQRYQDLMQAYHSNPASLKNHNIRLPMEIQISGSAAYRPDQRRAERRLRGYLGRSGAELVRAPGSVLRLQIQWSNEQVKAYLLSEKGTVLSSIDSTKLESIMEKRKSGSLSSRQERFLLKQFSRDFMQLVFTPKQ
ncbi:tetratricopeptide repeat protein [Candidatus Haliotispira prima]|uniref:Tetratricopeptide repeat protein n=1 Tax=Candidatus Haliotispira prima TaxID=3034016 RepID=A0ABY8MLD2_9SPIO|nr:tetratricopeptide repeat protein [Candidatus Haliotispira prima]